MHPLLLLAGALILARWSAQLVLETLNRRHVQAHADTVPEAFRNTLDAGTYAKAVDYTLAKNRFGMIELTYSTLVLLAILYSGALPWFWNRWTAFAGTSAWAEAAGLFVVGVLAALPALPLDWWTQFRLEDRFGFNTSTQGTWWMDRAKTLLLSALLGIPLLALLLRLVVWTGASWWVWGWGAMTSVQLLMLVLAPVVILPWFNKFTPLPPGPLRDRLLALAERTRFRARSIEVMDGSKRSRHANAFFTGLGRFRKIVLYDTLVTQLAEPELEAVLAHEIGHYRCRHIPKMLAGSSVFLLLGFGAIAWLARQPEFFHAFGFGAPSLAVAFLLFALLADTATFWLSPITHVWSRRFEYQADAFARAAVGTPAPLIGALRKLHEKNLANLTPHPAYSAFYYSHPTLLEREAALAAGVASSGSAGG